jgi:DNA-binding MarR family transcriptional regulator
MAGEEDRGMAPGEPREAQLLAREIGRDCVALRVRILGREIARLYDAHLRPHGATIAQLNVLVSVANLQPVRSGQLAELLSMEISTLSRNAALMADQGWLEVARAGSGNGRLLRITEAGEEKLAELAPSWAAAQREAAEMMGGGATAAVGQLIDGWLAERIARALPGGSGGTAARPARR